MVNPVPAVHPVPGKAWMTRLEDPPVNMSFAPDVESKTALVIRQLKVVIKVQL